MKVEGLLQLHKLLIYIVKIFITYTRTQFKVTELSLGK